MNPLLDTPHGILWNLEALRGTGPGTGLRQYQVDHLLGAYSPAAMELVLRIDAGDPLTEDEAQRFITRRPAGMRPSDWSEFVWDACKAAEADPLEECPTEDLVASNTEWIDANPDELEPGDDREAVIARLVAEQREEHDREFRRTKAIDWQWRVVRYVRDYLAPVAPPISGEDAELLTQRQWAVCALLLNCRMTPEEASERLGVSATTVQRHLEEAAKTLGLTTKELRRRTLG